MIKFEFTYWILVFIPAAFGSVWLILRFLDRRKRTIALLRAMIYLVLIFLLLQPVLVRIEKKLKKTPLAVLVDVSKSMDLKFSFHKYSRVKNLLKGPLDKLSGSHELSFYAFSSGISRVTKEELLKLDNPKGEFTDIGGVLNLAKEEIAGKASSNGGAILLITDGNHNAGPEPGEFAKSLGLPVSVIGIGDLKTGFDIELKNVLSSEIAFRNIKSTFTGVINGFNAQGRLVRVVLKKEGAEIEAKTAVLGKAGTETLVSFEYLPKETGLLKFELSIVPQNGEINKQNNRREFFVRVLKEKVRLLYISGSPNYEYRFLRQVLNNNPNYEVVTFIILRGLGDVLPFPESEYTLIPFPVYEIFTKEIFNYDVLIMENFSYRSYLPPELLKSINDFVEKAGGAFVMLGGPEAFGSGGYKNTAVENILPVELYDAGEEQFIKEPFRVKPAKHPINMLSEVKGENEEIWAQLPELKGFNRFMKAKPGAVVLGTHPVLKGSDGNYLPVTAVWQKGKGRVLAMAANNTWRWSMWLAGTGKGSYSYGRYWQQLFNWLISAPDVKQIIVAPERPVCRQGEEIKILVTVLDEFYQYEESAAVALSVIDPNGKTQTFNNLIYSGNGVYELLLPAELAGRYIFNASVEKGSKLLGLASNFATVNAATSEDYDIFQNEKLLKELAAASSGAYCDSGNIGDFVLKLKSSQIESISQTKAPVYDSPLFFVVIIVFLAIEWYLRRISGLL